MRSGTLYNAENNQVIMPKVLITENWFERARGLLGRKGLQDGEAMLISPCNSIHTFFMSSAIDVVYLDKGMNVVKICPALTPWHFSGCTKAQMVLELPAHAASHYNIQTGMRLSWHKKQ